ncbi:hydroxyethylthiazole kinase [Acuticoccus sp. M5D2P5]|uniref:hydroxyethylthiazole kinase n=1 Tax=Acuticoccus kalidii TaxID=2910977 RepID=UPI001F1805D2|nr:hydroxyethylthiazole kinase [Acuticoccus kalidii]MCF3933180.1 hydroxyethylthiazole kinase [Acuticoccus kalidii]
MTPGETLTAMRAARPLAHTITNYVAMNTAANALLAAGASPAMVHAPEEAGDFAAIAGALSVNIGTLSPLWVAGMKAAIAGAKGAGRPWVLDPVAHFATPWRSGVTRELLAERPTIVRGNASEIIALSGASSAGRGVDAGDAVDAAREAAEALARETGGVVAVTGEIDLVTDGERAVRIRGGSDLMPMVTALGCALSALTGAYAAVAGPFDAAHGACCHFAAAGEIAERGADGPGTFAVRFIDALAKVTPADVEGRSQ